MLAVRMPHKGQFKTIVSAFTIVALGCIGCALAVWGIPVCVGRRLAQDYNTRLSQHGIEATWAGVDCYVWNAVRLGARREDIEMYLAPLGQIGYSEIGDEWMGISLGLDGEPGGEWGLSVPPDMPPVYKISVRFENERIVEIGQFSRADAVIGDAGGETHHLQAIMKAEDCQMP